MKVKISADSTCDLSQELVEKYNVKIVPLYIQKGGEYFRDGLEINTWDVFKHFDETGDLCRTAAVNVEEYRALFTELKQKYEGVVHFTISSDMSSCYQNAVTAAKEFENVYVVDSRNLSTGIGQLVIEASLRAEQGMDAKRIFEEVSELVPKLDVSFVLDTLTYLAKGGRCSSIAAFGAGLLQLRPSIEVVNGKMGVGKKYRGKMEPVVESYVKDRLAGRDDLDDRRIFITVTGFPDNTIPELLEKYVRQYGNFKEILHTNAGCTVSSHCGPKCYGILYLHKDAR